MLKTIRAKMQNGKIELLEDIEIPEGTIALVTLLDGGDKEFWLNITQESLNRVWKDSEDDVYEQLLDK